MRIDGLARLGKKLTAKSTSIGGKFQQALYIGGLYLQRESQKIVPVEHNNLKGGAFTRPENGAAKPTVKVGYVAKYAVFVHEDAQAKHGAAYNREYRDDIAAGRKKSRGPNQQYKFLEKPLREKRGRITKIVKTKLSQMGI